MYKESVCTWYYKQFTALLSRFTKPKKIMAARILLLADISSSHTEKWASALAQKGYQVGIFSLNKSSREWYVPIQNIYILYTGATTITSYSVFTKLNYVFVLPKLINSIRGFHPDIVHAHYASSYGLLGALSKFKPFVISAWGSDVYEFPKISFIHKAILKFNLKAADKILSTSYVMKGELWKYSAKEIDVIPFGVNTQVFYPRNMAHKETNTTSIGIIKAMEDIYGIETFIEAIELVKRCLPEISLNVYLVGSGSRLMHYKKIVRAKNLDEIFVFTGQISFSHISDYHNLLDILVNVSTVNESFGVSVVEGMACEKAVIVSNAPGLKEVIADCGMVVEKENAGELAKVIMQLIRYPKLRNSMGKAARKHVLKNYDFKNCLHSMLRIYDSLLPSREKFELPLKLKVKMEKV